MPPSEWTAEDTDSVDQAFMALCELFGKDMSVALVKIYMRLLHRLPARSAMRAIENAIATCRFFPKPAELITLAEGSLEEQAINAWEVFSTALATVGHTSGVLFEDGRISALVDYFGGWTYITMTWLTRYQDKRRYEFVTAYKAMVTAPKPKRHPGIRELENDLSDYRLHGLSFEWVIVAKDGRTVRMLRTPNPDGPGFQDLPASVPRPALSEPEPENDGPLVPIHALKRQVLALFK
jgi:hypothetical protein